MPIHSFSLYVTGVSGVSRLAIVNARRLCDTHDNCELTIIDLLEEPARGERHRVIATPLLVKESPPQVFLLGDLSDTRELSRSLGLTLENPGDTSEAAPVYSLNSFMGDQANDRT